MIDRTIALKSFGSKHEYLERNSKFLKFNNSIYKEDIVVDSYNKIMFPYFPSMITETVPLGEVSLENFLESHLDPDQKTIDTFRRLEEATIKGDEIERSRIKQTSLYYFTPSVRLKYRNYASITGFNNILVAECDNIGEKLANAYKEFVFFKFKSCICAYLSPSKNGVKFLFYIPKPKSVEEYKSYFYAIAYDLRELQGFDTSNQNCVLPLFLSYDREILIREAKDIKPYTFKGMKLGGIGETIDLEGFEYVEIVTKEDKSYINKIIDSVFHKIETTKVGYPNVFNLACLMGGYYAAGYGNTWKPLEERILASDYLSKDPEVYIEAAKRAFIYGRDRPLRINYEFKY